MPCRDYQDDVRYIEVDRDSTVRILCEAYRTMEKHGLPIPSKEGQRWWEAHKKEDAARLEAERRRLDIKRKKELIMSKLTPDERKILGLK